MQEEPNRAPHRYRAYDGEVIDRAFRQDAWQLSRDRRFSDDHRRLHRPRGGVQA
ncbi:MAG: hypothetical protein LC749_01860 [Actinobacteria bacterium]|nr:hypothetical protein [Actinomycetota bacterium]